MYKMVGGILPKPNVTTSQLQCLNYLLSELFLFLVEFYFWLALGVQVKDEPSLQQGLSPNPDSASSKLCALGKRLISEGVSKSVKWKHLAQVGAEKMFFLFFSHRCLNMYWTTTLRRERPMISSICILIVIVFAQLRKQAGKWVQRVATEALE